MAEIRENDKKEIDFIGIGAMKAASSWIGTCLGEHPDICLVRGWGSKYFAKKSKQKKGIQSYLDCFEHCRATKIKGEYSSNYLFYKDVPRLIRQHFPDAKIIVCLRDPVERTFSHYRYSVLEKGRLSIYGSFEEAIERSPMLIQKGYYYQQLKRYYDLFPKHKILVKIYKDLKDNPKEFIKSIYRFLDVDDSFVPSLVGKRQNPTGGKVVAYKIPFFNYLVYKIRNKISYDSKLFVLADKLGLREIIKKMLLRNKKESYTAQEDISSLNSMNIETKNKLRRIYRDDIEKLEELIGKNLNCWK